MAALHRLCDGGRSVGVRVAAALARVGIEATAVGRTALDARVERLALDRPVDRVLATERETFLLATGDPLPPGPSLLIEIETHRVRCGDRLVALTPQQIALLEFLASSGGATPEELYLRAFGGLRYDPRRHRTTVYVAVARLRRCLERLMGADAIVNRSDGRYRVGPQTRAAVLCTVDAIPPESGLAARLSRDPLAKLLALRTSPASSHPS